MVAKSTTMARNQLNSGEHVNHNHLTVDDSGNPKLNIGGIREFTLSA